jgi:hypothetical protein
MAQDQAIKKVNAIPKSACIIAFIAMVICGVIYKSAAHWLQKASSAPVFLPVPLSAFPYIIGDWTGREAPLEEGIAEAAANDDFCSRLYVNRNSKNAVNLYIAYSASPRTMVGHRPDVCYTAAGWIHDSTDNSSFVAKSGKKIPCLIHRFHLPWPRQDELVVLNFYIINGKSSAEESGFSGIEWRTPNIKGDIARYVAQIQISSVLGNSVLNAAADMTDTIFGFLPDVNDVKTSSANINSVYPHKEGKVEH